MEKLMNTVLYKDGDDLIVVFKNAKPDTETIIRKVFSLSYAETEEIQHLEEIMPPEDVTPDIPAFLTNTPSNIGDYKISSLRKYAGKNKTLTEIHKDDAQWLNWIYKNYKPKTPEAQQDFDAIENFLKSLSS